MCFRRTKCNAVISQLCGAATFAFSDRKGPGALDRSGGLIFLVFHAKRCSNASVKVTTHLSTQPRCIICKLSSNFRNIYSFPWFKIARPALSFDYKSRLGAERWGLAKIALHFFHSNP